MSPGWPSRSEATPARKSATIYGVALVVRAGDLVMTTISVEEAQIRLLELIDQLAPGEDLVITRGSQPVARLVSEYNPKGQAVAGRGKGKLIIVSDDDDHLADFAEYM